MVVHMTDATITDDENANIRDNICIIISYFNIYTA